MRLLITGATGFLGGNVAQALAAEGHRVSALVRATSDTSRLGAGIDVLPHDGGTETIANLVGEAAPEVCIHTASLFKVVHQPADIVSLIESNLLFGAQLLDGLARANCSALINFGTSWQHYHTGPDAPDAYRPVSLYAATKQAFEDLAAYYVDAFGMRLLTLKLSDTYGPGDRRGKLVSSLIQAIRNKSGSFALSPGEQDFNIVHVDDVVAATRLALDRVQAAPKGSIECFALRGAETMTLREFIAEFGHIARTPPDVSFGARPYREREVMRAWTGPVLPGWVPRIGLQEGIRQLLA